VLAVSRLPVSFPAFTLEPESVQAMLPHDLDKVAAEFPDPEDERWTVFRGEHEPLKRQGMSDTWGPATTALVLDLIGPGMCQAVAEMLGYPVLVGDVYGGGMHLSGPGARLDLHTDFNRHPATGWRRRANLLIYLNHGWQEGWGGVLELDHKAKVLPEFGTLVLFECSERSWHGHPTPITEGHWRKSVAAYFYDPSDVVPDRENHDTLWWDAR
jgi:hypothetical protein